MSTRGKQKPQSYIPRRMQERKKINIEAENRVIKFVKNSKNRKNILQKCFKHKIKKDKKKNTKI